MFRSEPAVASNLAVCGREELYEASFPVLWSIRAMLFQCPPIPTRSDVAANVGTSSGEVAEGVEGAIRNFILPGRFMIGRGRAKALAQGCGYGVANISVLRTKAQFTRCWSSRLFIVALTLFLSGVVQEGWDLARSMLAGFKWVRAEICLDSQSDLAKASARLADDNFPSLDASDGIR
ncbi:uncharacterized protein Triagg1_7195 [Trichoderma aggressivum f. europaeum]|uniref:Uncharacterized protein n=1 Tax=Trichoderma aggressivum f. europaeum TaxID=173218 RepID=A0AAE1LX10_9HYPO|nr:hypothetical protein Triagg1_7195 [Trichoderma aggressivum f. europaeum]